jgi:hypothetical protein
MGYSVVDIICGYELQDLGSIPSTPEHYNSHFRGCGAMVAHSTPERKVVGSIPTILKFILKYFFYSAKFFWLNKKIMCLFLKNNIEYLII